MTAPPRIRSADQALTRLRTAVDPTAREAVDSTEQKFSLSATQVMASMAAAVTAALVGSRLGVAGTVIGAGLASIISVVGGAIIGHSILLTRTKVKRAVLQVRGAGPDGSAATELAATRVIARADLSTRNPAEDYTVVIPAVTRMDLQRVGQDARSGPGHAEPGRPRPTRPPRRRVSTGVLLGIAATLVIFVSALGAVTLAETIKGSPLSGGESGGLSVLGGNGGNPVDPTVTTAIVTEPTTVTQTVTSEVTAPATTAQSTATPSSANQSSTTAGSSAAPSSSAVSTQAPATSVGNPAAAPNPVASAGTGAATAGVR